MLKNLKKFRLASLMLALVMVLIGCSNEPAKEDGKTNEAASGDGKYVGIVMPTQSLQRWNQDGNNLKKSLEEKGYKVDLQFAQNQPDTQVSMIEDMIAKKVNYLVVGPIDGNTLAGAMD